MDIRKKNTKRNSQNNFITYDHLKNVDDGSKEHVSNTNMVDSYFDVPNLYTYSGKFKHAIVTTVEAGKHFTNVPDNLSVEEIEVRRTVVENLEFTYCSLGLNVVVERLPAYYDQYPYYRFICDTLFRRDQYKWHCLNSHSDICSNLNGWLTERCPLSMYGCPYTRFRLKPKNRTVKFNKTFSCFFTSSDREPPAVAEEDGFSIFNLPPELLVYLMFFLDNLSINCLAKTCAFFKEFCSDMVEELGIIVTTWRKKSYEESGRTSWKEDKKVFRFHFSIS